MSTNDRREVDTLRITSVAAPGGGVVLRLIVELDLSTIAVFVAALDDAVDAEATKIELDMSGIGFIDSSGVGAYVAAFRSALAKGCRVSISEKSAFVARVLELSGVEEALAREAADHA